MALNDKKLILMSLATVIFIKDNIFFLLARVILILIIIRPSEGVFHIRLQLGNKILVLCIVRRIVR